MKIRLNKYLSECSFGTRRDNSEKIKNGLIKINGKIAKPGDFINTEEDIVTFNEQVITLNENKIYLALNKPMGYISTVTDDRGRKTVMDLIVDENFLGTKGELQRKESLYPVGRLDKDSTGLLLLTNDGDFSNKVTHPKYDVPKIYVVETHQPITNSQITQLTQGVKIYETKTLPAEVQRINKNTIEITLHQGLKRQIREMCRAVNLQVKSLNRIRIGSISIRDQQIGTYRSLDQDEIASILKLKPKSLN